VKIVRNDREATTNDGVIHVGDSTFRIAIAVSCPLDKVSHRRSLSDRVG
jgi:hypothetical protein